MEELQEKIVKLTKTLEEKDVLLDMAGRIGKQLMESNDDLNRQIEQQSTEAATQREVICNTFVSVDGLVYLGVRRGQRMPKIDQASVAVAQSLHYSKKVTDHWSVMKYFIFIQYLEVFCQSS